MTDKIAEYKKRRAARIQKRLDAKNDNDEGRWVTTENDNRVHLNKNGVPDKGNPFVLAAMTGKKPKLSMNYHQKNVEKAIKTGKSFEVEEALEKLPNGSKILLNGQKYKAEFFNNEFAGGRGVEFVNEEDQDDILQSYEVTDELINNGDVSLEAPDRTEKESETTYEPDIEPEDEPFGDPDDDISFEDPDDLPYDMSGHGEESPQEMSKPIGQFANKKQMLMDLVNEEKNGSFVPSSEWKKTLADIPNGTMVKVGDAQLLKIDDSLYPFISAETGELVQRFEFVNMLKEAGDIQIGESTSEELPQESPDTVPDETAPQEAGSASGITSPDFKLNLVKSILALENPDVPYDEWSEKFNAVKALENQIPEGTEIQFGDHKLIKNNDPLYPYMNAETGELVDHSDFIDMIKEGGDFKIGSELEEAVPESNDKIESGVSFEQSKENLLDIAAEKQAGNFVPDNSVENAFKSLPDGTMFTTKFGAKWEKKTGEDGSVYLEDEHGKTQSAKSMMSSMAHKLSPNWNIEPPSESGSAKSYAEMTPVEQHKKDLLDALDTFKHQNKEVDIISALDQLEDGDVITVGKHSYTKQKDKSGSFYDKYVDENGTVSGNYAVKTALKEAVYLDMPVDLKGAEPKAEAPAQSQFNFSALQSEVNKLKGQTGLTKADKDQLNSILDDAPVGTTIAFSTNGDEYEVEKQSDGKWKENKHGGVYSGYNVANSFVHKSTELESFLPENESKNSDPYNLGEWNPPATPNQNAANNTSSNTKSWSGTKANGFGAVQEVKSDIDEFVSKHKSGITISKHILGDQLKKLEDGSSVKVGAKTYVKDTDDVGSITFQNSNNEFDTLEPYQLAAKIADKAKTFDNPIIEVNDPANSPKKPKNTVASVYIPESIPEPKKADNVSFSDNDYSQERKDNAVWDTGNGQSFDNVMRGISGKVWQGLNQNAKNAVWEYTTSSAAGNYSNVNNFLRKPNHDNQSEEMQHKMRNRIGYITKAISQSLAPRDMWVQRGIPLKNLKRLFNISDEQFNAAERDGMGALLDAIKSSAPYGQDNGFMSCGSTKGHGFSGSNVILNIYCPKGTQMLYAEPFSAFGNGSGKSWNGTDKQTWFSSENETIIQRGTKLAPTKITKSNGTYYVDVEVIGQEYSDKL